MGLRDGGITDDHFKTITLMQVRQRKSFENRSISDKNLQK